MQALADQASVFALLNTWQTVGWLRALDTGLARFLAEACPDAAPELLLTAALVSHQAGRGHVCLDMAQTLTAPAATLAFPEPEAALAEAPPSPAMVLAGLSLADWQARLGHAELVASGAGNTPLVRVDQRVYLRRYWGYEQQIRQGIEQRLASPLTISATALQAALAALFPAADPAWPNWQKLACALAARQGFAIITGGPGTGKTTTVVKLLAVLQALCFAEGRSQLLTIRLAAPTGKAAARLNESIAGQVQGLDLRGLAAGEQVRAAIPTAVTTLHRLLGARPHSRQFRYHRLQPLAADVVVVDEASMVDVELMARLLAALPASTRLILLGDKDQLASVEAGAVLGDLCRRAEAGHYTPATRTWLARVSGETLPTAYMDPAGQPLDQAIAMLRVSYRFAAASGIGQLARAVNAGETATSAALLQGEYDDIALQATAELDRLTRQGVPGRPHACGYDHYLQQLRANQPQAGDSPTRFEDWARLCLDAQRAFQLLAAVRHGPWGVDRLNQRIVEVLSQAGYLDPIGDWYLGRPVMVTRNDYELALMNGDVGLTLLYPVGGTAGEPELRLCVAFPATDGGAQVRWFLPSRLTAVETVFAMTVHKSQGSEFTHVALALPEQTSPVLTRELLYTSITRARRHFTLLAPTPDSLTATIKQRVLRMSGL